MNKPIPFAVSSSFAPSFFIERTGDVFEQNIAR